MTTLEKLEAKARMGSTSRMPSIAEISKLLTELEIPHTVMETFNTVEYRSKGRQYVNSRHRGKEGKELDVDWGGFSVNMDTSDSYYSHNTWRYAEILVSMIKSKQAISQNPKQ